MESKNQNSVEELQKRIDKLKEKLYTQIFLDGVKMQHSNLKEEATKIDKAQKLTSTIEGQIRVMRLNLLKKPDQKQIQEIEVQLKGSERQVDSAINRYNKAKEQEQKVQNEEIKTQKNLENFQKQNETKQKKQNLLKKTLKYLMAVGALFTTYLLKKEFSDYYNQNQFNKLTEDITRNKNFMQYLCSKKKIPYNNPFPEEINIEFGRSVPYVKERFDKRTLPPTLCYGDKDFLLLSVPDEDEKIHAIICNHLENCTSCYTGYIYCNKDPKQKKQIKKQPVDKITSKQNGVFQKYMKNKRPQTAQNR